jgi:hypothetical protein
VLTAPEQETWREIQRRLVDDPDLRPTLHPVERPGPGDRHRRARSGTIVVALTIAGLLVVGPNLPTDSEIADRQQPPRPSGSSAPAGYDLGDHAIGAAWPPARESWGPAGPGDIPVGGRVGVSAPPHGSAPSAAA